MHSNSAFLIAGTCSYAHEQRYVPGTELVNESIGMNKLQAQSNEAQSSSSNKFWLIFSKCIVRQQGINCISIGMKRNDRKVHWTEMHCIFWKRRLRHQGINCNEERCVPSERLVMESIRIVKYVSKAQSSSERNHLHLWDSIIMKCNSKGYVALRAQSSQNN